MKSAGTSLEEILVRKDRGRKRLAKLPFGEKLRILEAMKKEAESFRRFREANSSKSNTGF